ncbi:MAG: 3D-(3,5/4)-trihydroxycyclohexane-1,2-dione acylhydrolase (decyclizing), partial [Clostridia bacterium]
RAFGYTAYTVRTAVELKDALVASKKSLKPVLIDIKVLPKTMTDGYTGGFWQAGVTRAPRNDKQRTALKEQLDNIK